MYEWIFQQRTSPYVPKGGLVRLSSLLRTNLSLKSRGVNTNTVSIMVCVAQINVNAETLYCLEPSEVFKHVCVC